ncbi:MAG: hypothetical protein ACXIVQ_03185 [Acidimicrobiales bacterium]
MTPHHMSLDLHHIRHQELLAEAEQRRLAGRPGRRRPFGWRRRPASAEPRRERVVRVAPASYLAAC